MTLSDTGKMDYLKTEDVKAFIKEQIDYQKFKIKQIYLKCLKDSGIDIDIEIEEMIKQNKTSTKKKKS